SPPISSFSLGPVTIRFYALCLITGIIAAWWLGLRRWRERGGTQETFETVMLWAIPIGIVGARAYHVATHLGDYFGPGINPWSALFIWEGGIAIYGAIGAGTIAAWVVCRRRGARFAALADSVAPGIALGQAIGRFGNWFNQELYGWPTDLPWGLEIDPQHRLPGLEQYATFHPTFLYEMLWNLLVVAILLWADRRFRMGRGKVFALYVALYGFGRFFTEGMRTDFSYDTFGPIRFNQFVALLICLAGVLVLALLIRFRPGREDVVETLRVPVEPNPDAAATADGTPGTQDDDTVAEPAPDPADAEPVAAAAEPAEKPGPES
ncbi:MAG: prolipoprotein diacylglyceryl transferase, partial [Propionicimonas sp.]|nr:prolipoprotein diacylglyceryl transferase [Propionicimonas sp.]